MNDKAPSPFGRALVITTEAYGGFGGIATYNIDFVNALALCGFSQIDVVPRLVRTDPGVMPSNVRLHQSASQSGASFISNLVAQMAGALDVVFCGHVNLLPLAYPLARLKRVPLVNLLYGIEAWEPTGRFLVDRLSPKCDRHYSISPFTTRGFQSWTNVGDAHFVDLPNAIDMDKYGIGPRPEYLAQRYGLQDRRVVMTLGRLDGHDRRKGVDQLIDVTPILRDAMPDLAVLVCGDGSDRPRLEARVKEAGLSDHVIFAGRIPEKEKADHFRLCDVFSMVGKQEGFGFVFLEAMATGAPVVASLADGSRDAVLGGQLGELADPDDHHSIAQAIIRSFNKPRVIPAGLSHFSFENFRNRLGRAVQQELN